MADDTVTTVPLAAATNLTNGRSYIFTIGRVDAQGVKRSVGLKEVAIGDLSGTNFINCQRGVEGTAQQHNAGAVVEILMTAEHWNKMIDGLGVSHNKDGTMITGLPLTSPALTTPKITTAIGDANGNEVIKTPATASAVNEITVTNAATGDAPTITATGGDTNVSLGISAKGTGAILMDAYYQTPQAYTPGAAETATLDLSTGNQHDITMPGGNITIAISNARVGQKFIVSILQDGTGSRTVTWFSTIRWAGGSAPTLTTTASKRDTFGFIITGANTYDGFVVGLNA